MEIRWDKNEKYEEGNVEGKCECMMGIEQPCSSLFPSLHSNSCKITVTISFTQRLFGFKLRFLFCLIIISIKPDYHYHTDIIFLYTFFSQIRFTDRQSGDAPYSTQHPHPQFYTIQLSTHIYIYREKIHKTYKILMILLCWSDRIDNAITFKSCFDIRLFFSCLAEDYIATPTHFTHYCSTIKPQTLCEGV